MVQPVWLLANSVSPLAAALVFDATGAYTKIFIADFGIWLAAAALILLVRPPRPPEERASPAAAVAPDAAGWGEAAVC